MGHTGVLSRNPHTPIKGIFSSASVSTDESALRLFCFVSIIWEGDMPGYIIVQRITFPLGTQLHRSKYKHVLTGFPFLKKCIIYLTLHCMF